MLPAGSVDAQGEIDSILELQRTHGNRAVVQLIGADDAPPADVGGRADRLARAVSFSLPSFTIDMAAATAALEGLSATDASALQKAFEKRIGMPLQLVLSHSRISADEKKQLQILLQGSAMERFDDRSARKTGEAAGAFVGGLASSLGLDVDPDVAAKVGGIVLEQQARAGYEAERPVAEKAIATRRRYAEAVEVHGLMGKEDKERLFVLIGRTQADRMELADAYSKEYGTSIYNDLTAKLKGKELERFQSLWAGDKRSAEAAALAADTAKRKKAEEKAAKLAQIPVLASDAKKEAAAEVDKARGRQEQRVESLASSGELEKVIERAGPELEGVIEQDKILGFLRRGNVPESTAMRLVRAHREDKLTATMLEEALRSLRDAAEAEAYRSFADVDLGPAINFVIPLFVAGFYKRFEQEFDWQSHGGTLKEIVAKTGGDKALRERNKALLAGGGILEPWQELDFALRADPKDMDTVKRVFAGLSSSEIQDPNDKDKGVAADYKRNTKRNLHDDLVGNTAMQAYRLMLEGGDEKVDRLEKERIYGGGKFEPKATDPAERIAEEGRWLAARMFSYERIVMEGRGAFAKGRDWLGHIDKRLLDITAADASKAKNAMENSLLENPPDLAEANRQLIELRLISRRLDTNVAAYRKGTAEAWDEFVSFAAEIVTAIGTGGGSVAMSFVRRAVITAVKSALYTVGTKLVLDASHYTPRKLLADLRSAAGSALGAGLAERYVAPLAEDLAWSVSAWAAKRGIAPGLVGKATEFVVRQEGEVFVGGITTALATGEDLQGLDLGSQLHGLAVGHGAGMVREGSAKVAKGAKRRWDKARKRGGAAGEEPTSGARPTAGEPGAPTHGGPEARGAGRGTEDEIPDLTDEAVAEPDDAELPAVSMALPEAPTPTKPRPSGKRSASTSGGAPGIEVVGEAPGPAADTGGGDAAPKPTGKPDHPGRPNATGQGGPTGGDASTWRPPDTRTFRPGATMDTTGKVTIHRNVEIHPGLGDVDLGAVLREMDRTPWGERLANRIRDGELPLVIMPYGPEFPFGGLNYAGGKAWIRWTGNLHDAASLGIHEGSHNVDPATINKGGLTGSSNLGIEADARAFEYEYNEIVGAPPGEPAEVDYRAAFRRVEIETAGTQPTSKSNPFGADLRRARMAADKAMIEAMRKDPWRYGVETVGQEEQRLASRRDPDKVSAEIDAILPPLPPVPDVLEIETMFGGEPEPPAGHPTPTTGGGGTGAPGKPGRVAPAGGGGGPQAPSKKDAGFDAPGMPPQTIPALTAFAKHYHLVIDIRPPGSRTAGRLAEGAIAKPEAIKAKTINDADLLLGAPRDAIGLVGYFEPKLPARPRSMGDADWAIVKDRFTQRAKEFTDLAPAMAELITKQTIQITDGVVHAVDPLAPGNGPDQYRPVAGDVDIYQIQKANGRPLSRADAERYAALLRSWGIAVEHGAHLRWKPKDAAEREIYKNVIDKHGPGGEPLIRIEAGDAPKLVDNTTPITPRPGADYEFDVVAKPGKPGQAGDSAPPPDAPLVDKSAATIVNADVGSMDRPAVRDEGDPSTRDLREEPNRPASRSTAQFEERSRSRYAFLNKVGEGINGGWLVRDLKTNTLHLFKSNAYAKPVDRAQDRGIHQDDYAARSAAAELAANELGVRTPKVELVRIGQLEGSLTEWWPTESLARLAKRDPTLYAAVVGSPEFKKAQAAIDALDYLVNNLDRNQNLGNYLIQLDPRGNFVSLAPIDHDLTFTSTGMRAKLPEYTRGFPSEYPPQLAIKLLQLERNLPEFLESIRPLVGDEALPGVERRLKELLADMETKRGIEDRAASKTVGAQ